MDLELEVGGLTGAAHGEKSLERLVQRIACPGLDPRATASVTGEPPASLSGNGR